MIIDPDNENVAIDEDGELMHAVRLLPIDDDGVPPTIDELREAPILGYGGKFTFANDDWEVLE